MTHFNHLQTIQQSFELYYQNDDDKILNDLFLTLKSDLIALKRQNNPTLITKILTHLASEIGCADDLERCELMFDELLDKKTIQSERINTLLGKFTFKTRITMSLSKSTFSPHFAFGICLIYFILLNVVQLATLLLVGLFFYGMQDLPSIIQASSQNGFIVAYSVFFTALFFIIISPTIIYKKTKNISQTKQFFQLQYPTKKSMIHGFFSLFTLLIINECILYVFNNNPMIFLDSIVNPANQYMMIVAVVFFAPIYEEIIFRGMMYGAIANIQPNQNNTIKHWNSYQWLGLLISSILFTCVHLQYDWLGLSMIFVLALLFGYVRIKYGLWLAILLHMTNNAIAMINYLYF